MAELIALHWGTEKITAFVPAKGQGGRAVALHRPEAAADSAALGSWLKLSLGAAKISAKKAAIVLPRSAAVFRKLSLPDVPDEELPDLVRMQTATKSPTPLDRLRLDFVPLPRRGEGREVLLATVPAKTVDEVLTAVRAAGLEPASVGISPFGTAARVASGDEATLVISVDDQSTEITLVRAGCLLFSHVGDLPGEDRDEDRQWLLSEISRAVIAADHIATNAGISKVALIGPGELLEPLAGPMSERYGAQTDLFDTPQSLGVVDFEGDVSVSSIAAAAGQLLAGGPERVDLLRPRKRVEKPDRRRLHLAIAAGGAIAVLASGYAMSWLRQSDLDGEITRLRDEQRALQATLTSGKPTLLAHDAIQEWLGSQANWTEELTALDAALPGTDRIYLTNVALDPGGRDTLGQVKGAGATRTLQDVRSLNDALAAEGYQVNPTSSTESPRDPDYPIKFELDFAIPKQPTNPSEPSTALTVSAR